MKSGIVSKTVLLLILLQYVIVAAYAQAAYYKEQIAINSMLDGTRPLNLQHAVFSVENAYFNGELNKTYFNNQLDVYAAFCHNIIQYGDIRYEGQGDEKAAKAQCAVFVFMTDSIPVQIADSLVWHLPFEYNFEDYAGRNDWSSMFVSTLLQTNKGNCNRSFFPTSGCQSKNMYLPPKNKSTSLYIGTVHT